MNILLISSPSNRGAGNVSYNLKSQLQKLGHNVIILSRFNLDNNDDVVDFPIRKNVFKKIATRFRQIGFKPLNKYHFFDRSEKKTYLSTDNIINNIHFQPDLMIVSFYQRFLNWKNFYELQNEYKVPVLFWMMDMATFTGGCHYSYDCTRYINECGECPALKSNKIHDISWQNIIYKDQLKKKMNCSGIAISEHQKKQAQVSRIFSDVSIFLMYHAIDLDFFKPMEKSKAQKQLNLSGSIVLLFCASHIHEERKGFDHLMKALKLLQTNIDFNFKIDLIVVGDCREDSKEKLQNINVEYIGNTDNKETLKTYYQAATYTIIPTLADSGPLTAIESFACGTPIIAYPMGIPNDFKNKQIGFITNDFGPDELKKSIYSALFANKEEYQQMVNECIEIAQKYFSKETQRTSLNKLLQNTITIAQ